MTSDPDRATDTGDAIRAERLRALAHPARLAILRKLAHSGTCVCGEVVQTMPLAQSTVSQHLKVLKDVGLIRGTVEGPHSCYCLDRDAVASLAADLAGLFAALSDPPPPCDLSSKETAREPR